MEALDSYRRFSGCFGSRVSRAAALGLTENALAKWDEGKLLRVNVASHHRAILIDAACSRLADLFPRRALVGEFLLSPIAGSGKRCVDLLVETGDPDVPMRIAQAERAAAAKVVLEVLPQAALSDEAWAPLVAALSPRERAIFESLEDLDDEPDDGVL